MFGFIAQPSHTLQHAVFSGQSPCKGENFLCKNWHPWVCGRFFSENDWAASSQNLLVRISRHSHQAVVPWQRGLTNGSSTFEFWYGGRSVGLRGKTLKNRWATKRISVYNLARARIKACWWITDKSPKLGKTFYVKIYPPRFAVPEHSGFLQKRLGLFCAKIS